MAAFTRFCHFKTLLMINNEARKCFVTMRIKFCGSRIGRRMMNNERMFDYKILFKL